MNDTANMLMQRIYETGFAMDDIVLYLDTHPCDQEAIRYYHYVTDMRREAMAAYECQFGPLMADAVKDDNQWSWLEGRWPWEGDR